MSNNHDMLVKWLSLSSIGDLLKERLGEESEEYVFPEDFERAIADIGFRAVVFDGGDASSSDIIIVGDGLRNYQFSSGNNNTNSLVKSIRFVGYTGLKIPRYCFYGGQALTEFICPKTVTLIEMYAFYNCRNLTHLWLPKNVAFDSGNAYVLQNCFSLTTLGEEGHGYRVEFEAGATTYPNLSYSNGLLEIYVPEGVVNVYSLSYCTSLNLIEFPSTLVRLPNISNSTSLTEIRFPNGNNVVDWDGASLSGCRSLRTLHLPKCPNFLSSQSILSNCVGLTSVETGSIGFGATVAARNDSLTGCTQTGLTITAYVMPEYISTFITNVRNKATHATIIIKAPYEITYNGVTYLPGETVVTSTP